MSPLPEVEVTDLWKSYPRPPWHLGAVRSPAHQALRGVSFDVLPGEVVALIGPNGAGKSTLLRILSGLLLPSRGRALVSQLDVVKARPQSRRSVGATLSDDRGLSPRLTVRQNLQFFSALYGLSRSDMKTRIEDLSHRFEATDLLDRDVRTLSTGERARAILIRLLLHRPRAVLMDEITRFLDPGAAQRLRKQILQEVAGRGAAVLFASHDLNEVEAVASRVLLLSGGQTAAFGPFSEVRRLADRVFATAPEPRAE